MRWARFDGAEPGASCSPQESDEQRFCLIVSGVPGERSRWEDLLAGGAGSGFEIRAGARFNVMEDERHANGRSDSLSVFGFAGRCGAEVMVDVMRRDVKAGRYGEDQQRTRVSAARKRTVDVSARGREDTAAKEVVDVRARSRAGDAQADA